MITLFSYLIPVINAYYIQNGLEAAAFCACSLLNAACEKKAKTKRRRNYSKV
jgi:hypothetical protein